MSIAQFKMANRQSWMIVCNSNSEHSVSRIVSHLQLLDILVQFSNKKKNRNLISIKLKNRSFTHEFIPYFEWIGININWYAFGV